MRNDLLRKAREGRGWSQPQLAQELGCSARTVRSWELDGHLPYPEYRSRLCDLFGMTLEELGFFQNNRHTTQQIIQEEIASIAVEKSSNRQRMLKRVQTCWIGGVLDASLSFSEGAFIHVEPECGKTTWLLSLAHHLTAHASRTHPMPVIFHLASWAVKRGSLSKWLVDELQVKYHVSRSLAQVWVAQDHIFPLLDGLEEVAAAHRAKCVQQMNAYCKDHQFVPMVVCCRASEYLILNTHVAFEKPVSIEPLSWEEIIGSIKRAGDGLQGVQAAREHDRQVLWKGVRSGFLGGCGMFALLSSLEWERAFSWGIPLTICACFFPLLLMMFVPLGGMAIERFILRRYRRQSALHILDYALVYAVKRILWRKTGEGLIFAHRLLLEYFSKIELEKE